MIDKIDLLIGETGCDRAQAELALQTCGYDLARAVQEIPNLLKDLLAIKVKLRTDGPLYGLWLSILNLKTRKLLRARSVVSYHPAAWLAPLEGEWFEFEKYIYACRLWEGSLQNLSQEVEQAVGGFLGSEEASPLYKELRLGPQGVEQARTDFMSVLSPVLPPDLELVMKAEVLTLGQYQSFRREPVVASSHPPPGQTSLVLRVALEGDAAGTPVSELRAGDMVYAQIIDPRDIAQYLAKLFGGRSAEGLQPLVVPIEVVEESAEGGPGALWVRVRFTVGISGEAHVPGTVRLRLQKEPSAEPWWRRWLR